VTPAAPRLPMWRLDWVAADPPAASGRYALLGTDHFGLDAGARYDEVADIAAGSPPDAVVVCFAGRPARSATVEAVRLLRSWLDEPALRSTRLVFVTRRATAGNADLGSAPLWGLVRSAQSEHPGRFALVDLDDSARLLPAAIASGEPQVAVRGDRLLLPRLGRLEPTPTRTPWDTGGTVLVTGAGGALGRIVTRHLVTTHGVRHLLLVGRGTATTGLAEELAGLGAAARAVACDVGDRDALAAVLATIDPGHPLTAVVHAAGAVSDGVVEKLTEDDVDHVFRGKVDGALNLHELTRELNLRSFVLFSSLAGVVGGAGQGTYAAANVLLDELAHSRRAAGLPAVSLGWGMWSSDGRSGLGVAGDLREGDLGRLARTGVRAFSPEVGLRLFDTAVAGDDAAVVLADLDPARLRAEARSGALPAVLSRVAGTVTRKSTADTTDVAALLAGRPDADRERILLDLVRGEAATVLGHASPTALPPDRGVLELGFDSLTAVELRNRIESVTGLRLPTTLVFDHPTLRAVAEHLGTELSVRHRPATEPGVLDDLAALATRLSTLNGDAAVRGQVADRLRSLLAVVDRPNGHEPGELDDATDDEIFDLIDSELSS
uniref:type I polyketide synthase n=1 Tax=Lentzea kentuckyensis TaxID=360086 RepID=UPI001B805234